MSPKKHTAHVKICPGCGARMIRATSSNFTGQKHGIPGRKIWYRCSECQDGSDREVAFREQDYLNYLKHLEHERQAFERDNIELTKRLNRLTQPANVAKLIGDLRESQRQQAELIKILEPLAN